MDFGDQFRVENEADFVTHHLWVLAVGSVLHVIDDKRRYGARAQASTGVARYSESSFQLGALIVVTYNSCRSLGTDYDLQTQRGRSHAVGHFSGMYSVAPDRQLMGRSLVLQSRPTSCGSNNLGKNDCGTGGPDCNKHSTIAAGRLDCP
jgi:hypothetical protein